MRATCFLSLVLLSATLLAGVAQSAEPSFTCFFTKTGYEQKLTDGYHSVSSIAGQETTNEVEIDSHGIYTMLSFHPDAVYGAIPGKSEPNQIRFTAKISEGSLSAKGISYGTPIALSITLDGKQTEATETMYVTQDGSILLRMYCKRN